MDPRLAAAVAAGVTAPGPSSVGGGGGSGSNSGAAEKVAVAEEKYPEWVTKLFEEIDLATSAANAEDSGSRQIRSHTECAVKLMNLARMRERNLDAAPKPSDVWSRAAEQCASRHPTPRHPIPRLPHLLCTVATCC